MPRPADRRIEHYEEAVVKNIDRPEWAEEKRIRMFDHAKEAQEQLAQLDQQVATILRRLNVPTIDRAKYYAFARKLWKTVYVKLGSQKDIDALKKHWINLGADAKVINEITKMITSGGTFARK